MVLTSFFPMGLHGQDLNPPIPRFALKTNALYWAATTPNIGFEAGISPKFTIDISGNYNPWRFPGHKQLKHWLIQPELRYWTDELFHGHFIGPHMHFAGINASNILGMGHKRYQGYIYGLGFSYGYRWSLNKRWSMEAEIGIGYAHIDYDRYICGNCGARTDSGHKNYVGPTKVALNIVYVIK